jgi:hypothetical protein
MMASLALTIELALNLLDLPWVWWSSPGLHTLGTSNLWERVLIFK